MRWGFVVLVGLAGCSRSIAPEPTPQAAPSASVAPSASASSAAQARPPASAPLPPGPAVVGLRWQGLQVGRPLERAALVPTAPLHMAGSQPPRIGVSFTLVGGEAPTTFEASITSAGQVLRDVGREGRGSWAVPAGETLPASLGVLRGWALLEPLFQPTPAAVTLTVRTGERVLQRTELRREAFEGLTVDFTPEEKRERDYGFSARNFRTELVR